MSTYFRDIPLEVLFKRLQLGTPLNTAEKINAISGDLRDFCHDIAKRPFFSERLGIRNTRYTHFETVVKWVFVETRGIQPLMRYLQLASLLEGNRTFSRSSEIAKRVEGTMDFLERAFPDDCKVIRSRANALSVCMLAYRLDTRALNASASPFRDFVSTFFKELSVEVQRGSGAVDKELLRYQQAITSGSTGGESIRTRISILTRRLATQSPSYASLLSSYPDVDAAANRAINELQRAARGLVYEINRAYSGAHGEDLFKMTTKSSEAMDTMGEPCVDMDSYGRFVDALYFLVYEGSGNCARLPTPVSGFAMDVKSLRTDERHDRDHGARGKAAKRILGGASVFEGYSGKKTPRECGPDELKSTQLRILKRLVEFLTGLKEGADARGETTVGG